MNTLAVCRLNLIPPEPRHAFAARPHQPGRFGRSAVFVLLALVLLPGRGGIACAGSPAVPQLLLTGSELTLEPETATTPRETIPLAGGFLLAPTAGPLDWDFFRVADLRTRRRESSNTTVVLRGDGTYQRGGRTGTAERLRIDASGEGWTCVLDSGIVPIGPGGSLRSIDLKGTTLRFGTRFTVGLRLEIVPELGRWHYRLLDGSEFLDDCPICDRVSIPWPMRGSFDLVLTDQTPIGDRYRVVEAAFTAGNGLDIEYTLAGEGAYEIGGEVAVRQALTLTLDVVAPANKRTAQFLGSNPTPGRRWPMFDADADETTGSPGSTYRLKLRAAPFRELWFTTRSGMTPGNTNASLGHISGGDVLADTGRRVRTNAGLLAAFGWKPDNAPPDVHTLATGPGGAIWFSLDTVQAPDGRSLSWSDVLADDGTIVTGIPELLRSFGLMPPVPDAGLDAFQQLGDGERLFSLRSDVFSERLGQVLHHGDILSERGSVVRTFPALLAVFRPADPKRDPGLDAFHVWPSGEVWFSTAEGFVSQTLGPVLGGDLLSEDGYVVSRNLDLLRPFAPLEDLADFGLDDLFVLTDTDTPPGPSAGLAFRRAAIGTDAWILTWTGPGRVFQVEQATDVAGFFTPAAPPQPGRSLRLPVSSADTPCFYRVRSW
jgi:hypothetical protein